MTFRQRLEPIRSNKYLSAAKGQPCQLRFVGICLDPSGLGHETTVFAHFRHGKGMAQKAHDFDGADACANCHRFLDEGWSGKVSYTIVLETMLRGLERTLENRIRRGVLVMPITIDTPASTRPLKPRKPREERQRIPTSQNTWPQGRKIPTRPMRHKEPTS